MDLEWALIGILNSIHIAPLAKKHHSTGKLRPAPLDVISVMGLHSEDQVIGKADLFRELTCHVARQVECEMLFGSSFRHRVSRFTNKGTQSGGSDLKSGTKHCN